MVCMINFSISTLTFVCLVGSIYLLNRMKRLKMDIDEKKYSIESSEENLWQLNTDLSRSILTKLRLLDRLSSSQV